MSQYHGHYQQPPPQQGQQGQEGYYNQYAQQQPPPQHPAQDGQPAQGGQYPGQSAYSQGHGSGSVQYQYGEHSQALSPRTAAQPGSYQARPLPPAQHPQQPQYNPQQYAPQSYNPQHYPSPPQPQYQYSPSAYAQSNHGGNTYSDQVAHSSGNYSTGGFSPPPSLQSFPQPPQRHDSQARQSQYASQQYSYYQDPNPSPSQQYGSYHSPQQPLSPQQNTPYPIENRQPQRTNSTQASQQRQYSASPSMPTLNEEWRLPPTYPASVPQQSPSYHRLTSGNSLPTSPSSTPGPTPPIHAPSRTDTLNRHPQARPLPGPPTTRERQDYFTTSSPGRNRLNRETEAFSQEDLYQQVENALATGNHRSGTHSPSISVSRAPGGSSSGTYRASDAQQSRNGNETNGHLSPSVSGMHYSDESDVEAAQGLAMMRMAEEEENRRQSSIAHNSFSGVGSQRSSRQQQLSTTAASDSDDYRGVDMSSFGGGYDVHMPYGGGPTQLAFAIDSNNADPMSSQHSSMRRSHASQSSHVSRGSTYEYQTETIHPFPPFNSAARVDAGGTGGLAEPSADGRRQSYDEGDEYSFMEDPMQGRFPDEPLDIFYQPASTSYRPLPPPPEDSHGPLPTDFHGLPSQAGYPIGPDGYVATYHQGQLVPRSTSLVSHTTTPTVAQPLRSKTDAEERKLRQQQLRTPGYTTYEATPATPSMTLDLPSLPGKRFMPSQLGAPAFNKCLEPWGLSSLLKWLLAITSPEQVTELKEAEVKEALVALFTNKVPTMNITDAEGLSNKVVQDMYAAETLVQTEEWVKIVNRDMEGVIFQLTGSGCYAPKLHDHVIPGRCYSHHCQRTLKKVNLQAQPKRTGESWAEFYKLTKEDLEGRDRKDLERQNILHEIVQTEDVYMEQLNILRTMYRDPLSAIEPSIITPHRKKKFLHDVFGKVDAIKQANEEHLLPQLKYRQHEQGPWVVGFSDIFRQWIRKAKIAYIDYAGGFPGATFMVRQEIDRNIDFRTFIDRVRNDRRSSKLGWDTFLKAPITRLQRYTLLLQTVLKTMKVDSEEKTNLKIAYNEVKAVTLECDARVAEMQRKVDLSDLASKLVLRPSMQNAVELNLDHFGRELIHRGDLQRMGSNRFTWLDCHALLFDHYLVLAKTVAQRAEQGGKVEKYDVSKLPIPMDLLILESSNDPPVQKTTSVKGLTTVRDVTTGRTATPDAAGLGRVPTNQVSTPGSLTHTSTSTSITSLQPVTSINISEGKDADRIMYPFKVKHLGRDVYTLFAPSENARRDWCTKITEAKTKHAVSLHNQNAEPFKLKVMADSAFTFDAFAGSSGKGLVIEGSPVDRAIKEVEQRFKDVGRPGPVCRARVNCATSFVTLDHSRHMVAVGTDFGVYLSDIENPRGWTRCIQMSRVTQVAVLEEFNLFLLISDKSLIAYPLDIVCPSESNGVRQSADSANKSPQKLSGSKDVGFFVTGKMKDRTLVFYKKRENLASVFKVLEPVYQKSMEKKRSMFKRGNTEFFRDYDEFYIPAECGGIDLFSSSLAVSTARGFEVLTLDKKQPITVPDLKAPHVQNIAGVIKDQKALSMLRLSDQEFLLVYTNCAVYINKHGDVSRSVIMEFVGTAQSAALFGAYLILFDNDFVEIRNAQNGRLKQIIAGNEIKCLDDGGSWTSSTQSVSQQQGMNGTNNLPPRAVKFVMQHPELEKTQLVVELALNEKRKD